MQDEMERTEIKLKQIEFAYHIALSKLEEILKISAGDESNFKLHLCHITAAEALNLLKRSPSD